MSFHDLASAQSPTEGERKYSEVVNDLSKAGIPVRQLHGRGHVAVTLAAGRVVGLAFAEDGPNLLWTHPELGNTLLVKTSPEKLAGGFGGDRLWFSPELRYHWTGKPDWRGLTNYKVPLDTDPGRYAFVDRTPESIALSAQGSLPVRASRGDLKFSVDRVFQMAEPPLPLPKEVDYVGIETKHRLSIDESTKTGVIDLWHLLQTPVGSTLIVPLRRGHRAEPLSYGMPGGWRSFPDRLVWRFEGKANAKIGIASEALIGRSAVVRRIGLARWCLIIRQFPSATDERYADHPYGVPRGDQVFQAWDGVGFGEMEYHSPILDAERGPRTLHDTDQLWAFGGSPEAIASIADTLLKIDIRPLLAGEPYVDAR